MHLTGNCNKYTPDNQFSGTERERVGDQSQPNSGLQARFIELEQCILNFKIAISPSESTLTTSARNSFKLFAI
jgi:hypothetical protein